MKDLSTLEYLYALRYWRASSERGSAACILSNRGLSHQSASYMNPWCEKDLRDIQASGVQGPVPGKMLVVDWTGDKSQRYATQDRVTGHQACAL